MVCDVSYHTNLYENRRATEWGVHCTDSDGYAWVPLPTTPKFKNAYRSKRTSRYEILSLLEPVCRIYKSNEGEI